MPPAAAPPLPLPIASAVALALLSLSQGAAAGPTGGVVTAGNASVQQNGSQTRIRQTTPRASLDWTGFSIGANESVVFQQPSSTAVALNRVIGGDRSLIDGALRANGHVFLINPAGVVFGRGASVDVGALVASSLAITNDDFMAGRYVFSGGSGSGSVINHGTIRTAERGYVALMGREVVNTGKIVAAGGSVAIGAGDSMLLDFDGDGLLSFKVNAAAANARIGHNGAIYADGGQVIMTAQAKNALLGTGLNVNGIVSARSLVERAGRIYLDGGRSGVTQVSGTLDVSASAGEGGEIRVLGENVALLGHASLDASGARGGGTVLVGGGFQGANADVPNARRTYVGPQVQIKANAEDRGDGGKAIVWADDTAELRGTIGVRGGPNGGDGGFAEVSGKRDLIFRGHVDATAPKGRTGTLLLDPEVLIIDGGGPNANGTDATDSALLGTDDSPNQVLFAENPAGITTVTEATLEALNANILLEATRQIRTGATPFTDGRLTIAPNRDLTMRTRNLASSGDAVGLGTSGIDLTNAGTNAPEIVMQGTGNLSITSGAGSTNVRGDVAAPVTLGRITTAGGGVTVWSNDALTLTGDVNVNGAGNVILRTATQSAAELSNPNAAASGGDLTLVNATVKSATGRIQTRVGGNIVTTTPTGTNIEFKTGGTLWLDAHGAIGTPSHRIDISVPTLVAVTGTPTASIFVNQQSSDVHASGALNIGRVPDIISSCDNGPCLDGFLIGVTTRGPSSDITIVSQGRIAIQGPNPIPSHIDARGAGSDIALQTLDPDADIVASGLGVATQSGDIQARSARNITGSGDSPNFPVFRNGEAGSVLLDAAGRIGGIGGQSSLMTISARTLAATSRGGGIFISQGSACSGCVDPLTIGASPGQDGRADLSGVSTQRAGDPIRIEFGGRLTILSDVRAAGTGRVLLEGRFNSRQIRLNATVASSGGDIQVIASELSTDTPTGTGIEFKTGGDGTLFLTGTRIGTDSNRIDISVPTLAVSGGLTFLNQVASDVNPTGALTVGDARSVNFSGPAGVFSGIRSGSDIRLSSPGPLTIERNIHSNASGGSAASNVAIRTTGADADVIFKDAGVTVERGNIEIRAARHILTKHAPGPRTDLGISRDGGTLLLEAGGAIGTSANPINTEVTTLAAQASDGGVFLSQPRRPLYIGTASGQEGRPDLSGINASGTVSVRAPALQIERTISARQVFLTTDEIAMAPGAQVNASEPFTTTALENAALKLEGFSTPGVFGTADTPIAIDAPGLFVVFPNAPESLPPVFLSGDPGRKPVYAFAGVPGHRLVFYNGEADRPPSAGAGLQEAERSAFPRDLLRDTFPPPIVFGSNFTLPDIFTVIGTGAAPPERCDAGADGQAMACR